MAETLIQQDIEARDETALFQPFFASLAASRTAGCPDKYLVRSEENNRGKPALRGRMISIFYVYCPFQASILA